MTPSSIYDPKFDSICKLRYLFNRAILGDLWHASRTLRVTHIVINSTASQVGETAVVNE